jgi:hypothetical protein
MRATQFVRRGLVAFAAVATLAFGFSGVASAQSPGAFIEPGAAVVYNPAIGYAYDIVRTDGSPTAILAVAGPGGLHEVVVQFLPELAGAAIINPGGEDIIVP